MPRVKLFDEQEVLEKAMELFWKQGYHATSIRDLIQHLGINRASLYDTYIGKKELFDRAFAHYREANSEVLRTFLFSHQEVRTGLKKLFLQGVEEAKQGKENKGCFVINTASEFLPDDKDMQQILQENQERMEQIMLEYLSYGVEMGQIPKDKDLSMLAFLLFTYYSGIQIVTKINAAEKELLASVDTILATLG